MNGIIQAQGLYFFVTGVWPLVHMPSFLWVTGPKTDLWLVKTVGILIAVIGLYLWRTGYRRAATLETLWLALGSAAGLGFIDAYYYAIGTLRWVYLLDAAVELVFVTLWLWIIAAKKIKV